MNDRTCRNLIAMALLFYSIPASARILHVPEEYPSIHEAVDASEDGDTVLVEPGEYTENLLVGKNILVTSSQGSENTIIHGYLAIGFDVDTTCVFRGFTIRSPNDRGWPLVFVDSGSPVIVGNIIENNRCEQPGAGIRCYWGSPIIRGNIVRNNFTSRSGGGIIGGVGSVIEGNIICGNQAGYGISEGGGAGGLSVGPGVTRYNLIVNNETVIFFGHTEGGGIKRGWASDSYIYNNTIVGNSARIRESHSRGGGIYFVTYGESDNQVVKNNIIAFNPYGGGVYATIHDSGYVDWDYNLVFGNGGGDYIGIEPGPHDIQADPLFVDRFSGDYHLLSNSPCIDAGDPDFPLDPDGTRADIGAYYFDQTVGIDDPGEPSGPYKFRLHQNYPNPFNSQTIISYHLNQESVVSLHIFSITGHFVKALANKERQPAGEHRYIWDGRDKNGKMVSTGIYFYELYVGDYRESKAMIMIK